MFSRLAVHLAAMVLILTVTVAAQPETPLPEDPTELRKIVHELFDRQRQLSEKASRGDEEAAKQFDEVQEKIKALIHAFVAPDADPGRRHYLGVLLGLIEMNEGLTAARVAEAGLRHHPDDPFLHEAAGQGWFMASCDPEAGIRRTRHSLRQARAHYQAVLAKKPDHARATHALFAIQLALGCYDETEKYWEKTRRETEDRNVARVVRQLGEVGATTLLPGILLMGKQQYAKAAATFQSEACRDQEPFASAILSLRCHALAGDRSHAYEVAGRLPPRGLAGRLGLWARADMLAWFGKSRQAVSLLERHPVEQLPGESGGDFRLAQQTHAGLIRLASMTPETWTETRLALPAKDVLGHNIFYMGADENGKLGAK